MDVGATASIILTRLAKSWGLNTERPSYKVSLITANGNQMAVDGIAVTYCKPEGCSYYRLIRFIMAPCAEEVLISYRDQVSYGQT